MRSVVWTGDRVPTQPYGWTTNIAEPRYSVGTNSGYFHCGIDIPMNTGEPLFAARAGVVRAVGVGFLAIQVGSEMDWYLHGSAYYVGVRQIVTRAQLIGAAGNVAPPGGASFGSHLHFERQSTLSLLCNIPSTSLDPVTILELPPDIIRSEDTLSDSDALQLFVKGTDAALWQFRIDPITGARAWTRLGGVLSSGDIRLEGKGQRLEVFLKGTADEIFHLHSDDAGAHFQVWDDLGGITHDSLSVIGPDGASIVAQGVDLSPVTATMAAIQSAQTNIKTELDKVMTDAAEVRTRVDKDLNSP